VDRDRPCENTDRTNLCCRAKTTAVPPCSGDSSARVAAVEKASRGLSTSARQKERPEAGGTLRASATGDSRGRRATAPRTSPMPRCAGGATRL
jgi:hypothetical protein